ncbi:LacI family DNA-binding transcriptional regulator [Pseudolysinimonas kribbensis]|uniref:LacI family DNA-binding transcriptional regulator n=1 Tax=Pseudolysinimonas kribbensis TaxID=433641 RepID=UPI0024E18DB4|nr:LacI family DNA-binding transcriptional regulator [Pseudolysinimonas kribbensis]
MAQLAGVDVAVVSKMLSGDASLSVRESTRERVLRAVAQLDYRPNYAARSLRRSRADAFGLVVPDFHNSVYSGIIDGAQSAANAMNYALLTVSASPTSDEESRLAALFGNGTIDGLLVAGAARADELVRLFRKRGQPVLSVNRRIPGLDRYVILDDFAAARQAVRHLVELGHTRIGHIGGPRDLDTSTRRLDGFFSAMQDAGLAIPTSYIVNADYTPRGGYQAMRSLLELSEPPQAVLAANVTSALGAMSAAYEAGVSIPNDLSLISIHDLDLAEYASPALTVIRMPIYEMGRLAVQLLADTPPNDAIEQVVDTPLELIARHSTSRPHA